LNADNRYPHVDAMRAIAALCVAALHISQMLESTAGSGQWLLKFVDDWQLGAFGVALFFIVSGFVIPASLSPRDRRGEGLRIFAIRRFFRLYPAYWLSIPLVLWSVWWLQGRPIDLGTVAVNVTLFQRPLGFQNIVNLYWTLSYELAFYLVCAALYAAGLLHRPSALIAVLFVLVVAFAAVALLGLPGEGYLGFYTDMPSHLGLMFTGAVLRKWHDGEPLSRWVKVALAIIVGLYVLPAARSFKFVDGQLLFHPIGGWSGAFAMLFFIVFVMRLRLSHPLLSWLGTISYSVYLFHTVWAYFAAWLLAQPGLEWARGWDLTVYCALILAATIAFSAGVYRWLELPMIELGRRLTRRRDVQAIAMASPAAPPSSPAPTGISPASGAG
jgi:peptidoglycan/LPS O-acetylase OafA/YrhL